MFYAGQEDALKPLKLSKEGQLLQDNLRRVRVPLINNLKVNGASRKVRTQVLKDLNIIDTKGITNAVLEVSGPPLDLPSFGPY